MAGLSQSTPRIRRPCALLIQAPSPKARRGAYILREAKIECGARSDDWPAETKTI